MNIRSRLTLLCIAGAALSAAFVKLTKMHSCVPCLQASTFIAPLPHLEMFGMAFYGVLAWALWRYKLNRYTKAAIAFAAGCHLALVYKLIQMQVYCIPCLVCAAFVGVATLLIVKQINRVAVLAIVCGTLTMYGAHSIRKQIEHYEMEKKTKIAIHFDSLDLARSKNGLPVYIFKRDSCGHCQQFLKDDLPRLRLAYGDKLNIHLQDAPQGIGVPTIVVGGGNPVMRVGKPSMEELSSLLDGRLDNSGKDLASSLSL